MAEKREPKYVTQRGDYDRTSKNRARAQKKALSRLVANHRKEYEEYYAEERRIEGLK